MANENENAVEIRIKPLSSNAFVAFFQRIARWWLGLWYGFSDKHPKISKLLYQIFFFIVFSEGVTIYQFLIFLFLPHLFGIELAGVDWMWPGWILGTNTEGVVYKFALLGKAVKYEAGEVVIGGGLGYFFAFLFATFTAQCINFPLQRNITFKSKGNPYYQFMWYIIGWIFIQPFCDGLISLYTWLVDCVIGFTIPVIIKTLLDTIIMGGVSMVIFFFVFLVIFPDLNKMAASAAKKVERLKAAGAPAEKIAAAEKKAEEIAVKATWDNARRAEISAASVANSKAVAWDSRVKNLEKAKAKGKPEDEIAFIEAAVEKAYNEAADAQNKLDEASAAFAALN